MNAVTQEQEKNSMFESGLTPPQPREACLDALARVLASQTFAKSARLSSFLRHVCVTTVEGQAVVLCEQHIGVAVFGRPEHFNPADDTIVRTTARLLRQRLAQYYAEEGNADALRIAIPRGTYVPVFVLATVMPSPTAEELALPLEHPVAATSPKSAPVRRDRRLTLGIVALVVVLVLAGATAWLGQPGPSGVTTFWTALLPADRDALLVVSDAGLVLYQLETRSQVSLEAYAAKRVGEPLVPPDLGHAEHFRARRYTGMSSVQLAAELGKRAIAAPQRLHLRFARDLQLGDLKRANVILLGVAQANPWWALYRSQLDFHIDWNPQQPDQFLILNDHPRSGEALGYAFKIDDPQRRGFATIAYTRGLGGDGHALLIGGTTSAGTEAAIEFLVDPARLAPLLKQASLADGSVGSFEILLQCVLQANGSTDVRILGFHLHQS
ncbi:hypothetical protein ACO0K9_09770 [Undibacterium sp. Ji50W]|uniref:hypothetical protein n=1 Tax=Undibacterium sp. Ji50W TaxID=3413041 RepID=UPI003BF3AE65